MPSESSAKDNASFFDVNAYPVANNSGNTIRSAFKWLRGFLIAIKFCSFSPKMGDVWIYPTFIFYQNFL